MTNDGYFLTGERQERYIQVVLEAMKEIAPRAERAFAGSQDGEAVIGLDDSGDMIYIVHLDPQERQKIDEAVKKGTLKEYILKSNGY
ncbi:hypothetical protein [Sporosarcina limicola]|uniref:Uncharacterized protein n=1 Tax=Sporosarcina limicola TaxID=34101 RepID=A0A927R7R1_9BACL|nr:hypothetical protein [Sporosarcina limicola]MBE1556244.1 hypothetical protein [Sporosarcina limicola]